MSNRITLLNIILLLIHESRCAEKNPTVAKIVEDALGLIKVGDIGSVGDESSLISTLRDIAEDLLRQGTQQPYELSAIRTQLKLVIIGQPEFAQNFLEELDEVANKEDKELLLARNYFYRKVSDSYKDAQFTRILTQEFFDLKSSNNIGNRSLFLQALNEKLAPFTGGSGNGLDGIPGLCSTLNLSNQEELRDAFAKSQVALSVEGMLKTGLQGINDALGGGFPRGAVINIDALTGRGKSETMRYFLRTIAKFNIPFKFYPDRKKNMLLYITLEDTPEEIVGKMFTDILEEASGEQVKLADVPFEEAERVVKEYFEENGYEFQIVYGRKHELKVEDIRRVVEYYTAQGYEIFALALDYLQLMYYQDMPGGNDPTKVKNIIGSIESFTKGDRITFFTANQLDSKAKEIARFEIEVASACSGKALQENCKSITNEVDCELTVHIVTGKESEDGYAYHQTAIGKCRFGKKVPANLKYAVHRMGTDANGNPCGFITPDIGLESQVRDATAGALRSEGGGSGW